MAGTLEKYRIEEKEALEKAAEEALKVVTSQLNEPEEKEEFTRKAMELAHQSSAAAKERQQRRASELASLRERKIEQIKAKLAQKVERLEAEAEQAKTLSEAKANRLAEVEAKQADVADDPALAASAVAATLRAEAEAQKAAQKAEEVNASLEKARNELQKPIEGPSEEELLEELEKQGSQDEADDDGENAILSIFEAKAKIRNELVRALRDEKQKKIRDKYLILNENLRNFGQVASDAGRARGAQPFRIGCDSKAGNDGAKFFIGSICHVAVYAAALTPHAVFAHRTVAMLNLADEANRLYHLATENFKEALLATPHDPEVLQGFARALCNQFPYVDVGAGDTALDAIHDDDFDPSESKAMSEYKNAIRRAVDAFQTQKNAAGLCIGRIASELSTRLW